MTEYCPDCQSEQYYVADEQTDFGDDFVSLSWTCKCGQCGCRFVIHRIYNLDPYYSYVEKMKNDD